MLRDRLVAHRGYRKHYPENTLLAYRKAIEAGARFIETDVLFSAEGEPVLYHDIAMLRISGHEGFIHSYTLEQLLRESAYEPDRLGDRFKNNPITSLSQLVELLQQHPEVTAFIEVKRGGIEIFGIEKVYEAVSIALQPVQAQCVLISFNDQFIHHARQQGYRRLGVVLKSWNDLQEDKLSACNPEFIFCDTDKVPTGATLDEIQSTTVIYEVEEPEAAVEWFSRGADMVETFDIGGMIESLAHKAL